MNFFWQWGNTKSQKTCNNLNSANAVKRKIENIKYI